MYFRVRAPFAFVALAAPLFGAFSLPELPPMPPVPAPRPIGSVTMGDPAAVAETKLDFPIAAGPFEPAWESIAQHYGAPPEWLREAKFEIWVHFAAQAAGRSDDWYAKRLYLQEGKYSQYYQNHPKNFGHPSEVGYKDVLRAWNPGQLDPRMLVQLYREAGARFLFIQAVHHDNFDNCSSPYQPWNLVNVGPKRDLLREWAEAARAAGLRYGIAFHHEYTWWWYQRAFGSDRTGPRAEPAERDFAWARRIAGMAAGEGGPGDRVSLVDAVPDGRDVSNRVRCGGLRGRRGAAVAKRRRSCLYCGR